MKNIFLLLLISCGAFAQQKNGQPRYSDRPYLQDFSIKYYLPAGQSDHLSSAVADRNGEIRIFGSRGLFIPYDGQFLYPGTLIPEKRYRTIQSKKIQGLTAYKDQFVFVDDQTIFSNAWAGRLFSRHDLKGASLISGGQDFAFLISDGTALHYVKDSKTIFRGDIADKVLDIRYWPSAGDFLILGSKGLYRFSVSENSISTIVEGASFTSFDIVSGTGAIIGTTDGYLEVDLAGNKLTGEKKTRVPVTGITAVRKIGEKVWFGTSNGAFALRKDGKIDYYQGERWLPGDRVSQISAGPRNSVLILTDAGLGQLNFKPMTLYDKAMYYEEQVRSRHIRNGFNADLRGMEKGNISTGYLSDSDNDGLWTAMYLGAETFRYTVTKEPQALENIREAFDAMEQLYFVTPIPGFPARSFERRGFTNLLADPQRWQHSPNPEWDWKATTSSDEAIGHIFAFSAIAELVNDADLKRRSILMIDTLMSHIVKNNMYLIDYDGKPTMWGRWNPAYVNSFPENVGDRKLNSSNIISMLQTAYRFTKKEKYKQKAFELMQKDGYLENLMRPFKMIGNAPDNADAHAKSMSDSWNHSDDEMYFIGYWGLYRYAFNETLRAQFKKAILDHWEMERPEKEGAWNIFTALTGTNKFDLDEAAWYLREHPLDLIDWNISNSQRKDIDLLPSNFRRQTTKEVLPPDERPVQRHNSNMFQMDQKRSNGTSEHSAGDIWLLPYWMGRYLGVISGPVK